jgi:hypothetical protein
MTTCYTGCLPPNTNPIVTHGPLSAPASAPLSAPHASALAFTGLDIAGFVVVGVILVVAGTLAVLWARGRASAR